MLGPPPLHWPCYFLPRVPQTQTTVTQAKSKAPGKPGVLRTLCGHISSLPHGLPSARDRCLRPERSSAGPRHQPQPEEAGKAVPDDDSAGSWDPKPSHPQASS